jgi:hypothetical protein
MLKGTTVRVNCAVGEVVISITQDPGFCPVKGQIFSKVSWISWVLATCNTSAKVSVYAGRVRGNSSE